MGELWVDDIATLPVYESPLAADEYRRQALRKRPNVVELWVDDVGALRVYEPPPACPPDGANPYRRQALRKSSKVNRVELGLNDVSALRVYEPPLPCPPVEYRGQAPYIRQAFPLVADLYTLANPQRQPRIQRIRGIHPNQPSVRNVDRAIAVHIAERNSAFIGEHGRGIGDVHGHQQGVEQINVTAVIDIAQNPPLRLRRLPAARQPHRLNHHFHRPRAHCKRRIHISHQARP